MKTNRAYWRDVVNYITSHLKKNFKPFIKKIKQMKNIVLFLLVFASLTTKAQVGIGVAAPDVDPSAQLEVKSTTKGLLSPRMTEAQKNAISNPATGLLIYQTDGTSGFYYYDGSLWKQGLGPQGVAGAAGAAGQTNTSLLYSSMATYADGAAPADAPSSVTSTYGNFGWYFKKTGNTKINWYIQPKSSSMKVSELTGMYLELFNVAITNTSDMPFITVYTKPTASGNAASWYKSKRLYTFSGLPSVNTKYLGFANLGAATPNTYNTSLLDLVAGTTTGTFASSEDILAIAIASSNTASTCEFVANKFGIITGTSTQEFLFMPPSSIANLSTYATTSSLNTEVSRAQAAESDLTSSLNTEVSRAQAAEATLTTSLATKATTTALNTEISRAQAAESDLTSSLNTEVSRAQVAEATLTSSIATKAPIASPSFTGAVTVGGASSTASAAVEVSSTSQGFLPPRMTAAQRDAISSPAAGLVLWCSNCGDNGELNVYNGTSWTNMVCGTASIALITPIVTPIVGTYNYYGAAQGPNSATNTGTGNSYTYSYAGTGSTSYGPSATAPSAEGTYTVTVTVAANGNYKQASSAPTAFSILPAAYRYYRARGYGCYNGGCTDIGYFNIQSLNPLTIGYFYNNPENRGFTFEILELLSGYPGGSYELTNEPGYADCSTPCYAPRQ